MEWLWTVSLWIDGDWRWRVASRRSRQPKLQTVLQKININKYKYKLYLKKEGNLLQGKMSVFWSFVPYSPCGGSFQQQPTVDPGQVTWKMWLEGEETGKSVTRPVSHRRGKLQYRYNKDTKMTQVAQIQIHEWHKYKSDTFTDTKVIFKSVTRPASHRSRKLQYCHRSPGPMSHLARLDRISHETFVNLLSRDRHDY